MKLILENVRCFAGRHEVPIRPLTLLIGENSSGKTTVLASLAAVTNDWFPFSTDAIHEAPYQLGAFDTIVSSFPRGADRPTQFAIGWHCEDGYEPADALATYVSDGGYPALETLAIGDVRVHMRRRSPKEDVWDCEVTELGSVIEQCSTRGGSAIEAWRDFRLHIASRERLPRTTAEALVRISPLTAPLAPSKSVAPLRTKPQRTYDVIRQEYDPEGRHLPHALKSLLGRGSQPLPVAEFGTDSGLFNGVEVRQLGDSALDPVQILVRLGDQKINLADVGYGVSQVLPILVEFVETRSDVMLLMQQPEVHLHPRAQAALSSLFATAATQRRAPLVVETHSDHIVDRVRLEIANGTIAYTDVALLWFERTATGTNVHEIQLDRYGTVLDPPDGYRAFFLEEEYALLTRASVRA